MADDQIRIMSMSHCIQCLQIWDGVCAAQADIILTPEYEHFAEAVMTSHSKADQQAALDISPAMGDILTDMQSCLQQLCGSLMCGDPEAVARLIAEKVAAMNYGSGCEHNSAGNGTMAGDLHESAVHQQALQARATATEAMSAKSAQIQTQVLYNTSGSVSTVQLAWREWTCNGGSNTIEDRTREISQKVTKVLKLEHLVKVCRS